MKKIIVGKWIENICVIDDRILNQKTVEINGEVGEKIPGRRIELNILSRNIV